MTTGPPYVALARESLGGREYLMRRLPNTLYTRRHDLLALRRASP